MWAKRRHHSGFTIVELLIVIVVIGILAAIIIVAYNGIQSKAKVAALQSDLANDYSLLGQQNVQSGSYPSSSASAGLKASPGTTLVYEYNYDASGNSYCLAALNGALSYYVTSANNSPQPGGCTPSDGLVAWWPMDGNANEIINGMNGTVHGATPTTGQNGKANSAYLFDGVNNYIGLASTTPLAFVDSDFSVNVWVNVPTVPTTRAWYDILSSTAGGDWSVGVDYLVANAPGYWMMTKVSQSDAPPPSATIPQTGWHMLTVDYHTTSAGKGTVSYYMDAQSIGGGNWDYSSFGSFTPAIKSIGARNGATSGFFNGSIDDLRVYNRLLSATEIQAAYAGGAQ